MRKHLRIGSFTLSPSPQRGRSAYTVTNGGAPTPYTIEKHVWCLFLDGQALPIGRYPGLEEALAAAVGHMGHADHRRRRRGP
jgi:hypothetical protein